MENIFKYLPSKVLLEFRLVSTEINRSATKLLKKRLQGLRLLVNYDIGRNLKLIKFINSFPSAFIPPTLYFESNVEPEDNRFDLEAGRFYTQEDVIGDVFQLLGDKSITKQIILGDSYDNFSPPCSIELLLLILRNLHSSLEILTFDTIYYTTLRNIEEEMYKTALTLFSTKFQLTSLRKLELKVQNDDVQELLPKFLRIIFTASPNLTEIYGECEFRNIIDPLNNAGLLPQMKKLPIVGFQHLTTLFALPKQPTLEHFAVSVNRPEFPILHAFLERQQSLKSLKLSSLGKTQLTLPVLPSLKKLVLVGTVNLQFSLDFSVARSTTNLIYLKITTVQLTPGADSQLFSSEMDLEPCNSLEELDLLCVDNPQLFPNLCKLFPNVKRATLQYPFRHQVNVFCSEWKLLEELSIKYNWPRYNDNNKIVSLDATLFGIDEDVKQRINLSEHEWWKGVSIQEPTIANLSKLRRLKIETSEASFTVPRLTDFSAYLGLLNLIELEVLSILHFPFRQTGPINSEISEPAREILDDNLDKLRLMFL